MSKNEGEAGVLQICLETRRELTHRIGVIDMLGRTVVLVVVTKVIPFPSRDIILVLLGLFILNEANEKQSLTKSN